MQCLAFVCIVLCRLPPLLTQEGREVLLTCVLACVSRPAPRLLLLMMSI